jgi:hypothetical protein
MYYAYHQQTSAGYPFYLDAAGNMQSFEPDTSYREVILYERGTYYNNMECKPAIGISMQQMSIGVGNATKDYKEQCWSIGNTDKEKYVTCTKTVN